MTDLLSSAGLLPPAALQPPGYAAPLRAVDTVTVAPDGPGYRVVADFAIEAADLRGHFPGQPIYPGVYILESIAQALTQALGAGSRLAYTLVRSARFLAPVLAGDVLRTDITVTPDGADWQAVARCSRADGVQAATVKATLSATVPTTPGGAAEPPGPVPAGGAMDHDTVRSVLPQRHPLLLIDRVLGSEPGQAIHAEKAVTATEPCFRTADGPWPAGAGAYPVSLLLESLGQAAALLWLGGGAPDGARDRTAGGYGVGADEVLMLVAVRDYRITGTAQPGDVLRHVVRLTHVVADTAFATGQTWAGGRLIAAADTLTAVCRPRSVLTV